MLHQWWNGNSYSESIWCRNPGDPPRLEDYTIDPKNNHGVSHAFAEVVRGKEARKSLPAASCLECARVCYFSISLICSFTHYMDHQRGRILVLIDPTSIFNKYQSTDKSGMRILHRLDSGSQTFQVHRRRKSIVRKGRRRMLRKQYKLLKKRLEGTDVGRRKILFIEERDLWLLGTISLYMA